VADKVGHPTRHHFLLLLKINWLQICPTLKTLQGNFTKTPGVTLLSLTNVWRGA